MKTVKDIADEIRNSALAIQHDADNIAETGCVKCIKIEIEITPDGIPNYTVIKNKIVKDITVSINKDIIKELRKGGIITKEQFQGVLTGNSRSGYQETQH